MSQINSNTKDDFQVVLLLSCFVGHPVPKPSNNWIQIIRFKEEYGGKYENNFTITFS